MNRDLAAVPSGLVILKDARWPNGGTIRVGFHGGNPRLQALIERVASEWSRYANVKFDFGRDANGNYRSWSPQDEYEYRADIRVGFDDKGYWSMVGNESIDPDRRQPGGQTLNLGGFDKRLGFSFVRKIRHEFGHAIGLEHEHQHPLQACDFRWDDEPGYQRTTNKYGTFVDDSAGRHPGVYTLMGGPPNNWSKEQVDFNLRQITRIDPAPVSAYGFGPIDKWSIMIYSYPDWMFVSGRNSPCYSPHENQDFSDEDKRRIAQFYPADGAVAAAQNERRREAINAVVSQLPRSSLLARDLTLKAQQLR